MTLPQWILTTDQETARLLRLVRTSTGRIHVDLEDEIHDNWVAHEHGRPSPRTGKRGHSYASIGHEVETRRDRFAKETAVWMERQADDLHIDHVAVFAPPHFLNALRGAWTFRFAISVDEHPGELARMSLGDLAGHASILELMSSTPPAAH